MSVPRKPAAESDPLLRAARGCIVLFTLVFGSGQGAAFAAQGGTLMVGVESGFRGFDPIQARIMGESTVTAAVSMYDTLVDLRDDGGIVPRLARSLRVSEDRRQWTAELRRDVRFHDGTPFDADAFVRVVHRGLTPKATDPYGPSAPFRCETGQRFSRERLVDAVSAGPPASGPQSRAERSLWPDHFGSPSSIAITRMP